MGLDGLCEGRLAELRHFAIGQVLAGSIYRQSDKKQSPDKGSVNLVANADHLELLVPW